MRDILTDLENDEDNVVKDPMRVAQQSMKMQMPKRFYKEVGVDEDEAGFAITLDGKAIKTPGQNPVRLPNQVAGELVAQDWDAQQEHINMGQMPHQRIVNTAVDGVIRDPQSVVEEMLRFSGSDLLCYRADNPEGLVELQRQHWDPILDWAAKDLKANFDLVEGLIHQPQPQAALSAFGLALDSIECPFKLACLYQVTALTGSSIIAMAVYHKALSCDEAWNAAHVDDDWQISQWGDDDEAIARRAVRKRDMNAACDLLAAL